MNMKNDILGKKIDRNQLDIINKIMKVKNKILFLKSIPQTGKTAVLKRLFDINNDKIKMFITGCNPKNMKFIDDSVLFEINSCINKNRNENISIFFDEYYNCKILDYFKHNKLDNVSVYISTNKISKEISYDVEIIDIYEDVFRGLDKFMFSKYSVDISTKVRKRSISIMELMEIVKILQNKKYLNYSVDKLLLFLQNKLKSKKIKRFLPTTTAILYINKDYQMLKTFEFKE